MRCVNEKCGRDADRLGAVVVSVDGDFACSPACKQEYEKQKKHFFDNIVQDEKRCERWLLRADDGA